MLLTPAVLLQARWTRWLSYHQDKCQKHFPNWDNENKIDTTNMEIVIIHSKIQHDTG